MKAMRATLILFFVLSALWASSQDAQPEESDYGVIKKGTPYIGTYFNFSTNTTTVNRAKGVDTESSTDKLGGNFTFGKMVSDHWGLHINFGFNNNTTKTPTVVNAVLYNLEENQTNYFIAPAVRHYRRVTEGIYVFFQGTAFVSKGTTVTNEFDKNDNLVTYTFDTKGYGMGISPGFTYFTSKKIAAEIAIGVLGFSVINGSDAFGNKTQTSTFQSLFYQNSVSLGFVYYF